MKEQIPCDMVIESWKNCVIFPGVATNGLQLTDFDKEIIFSKPMLQLKNRSQLSFCNIFDKTNKVIGFSRANYDRLTHVLQVAYLTRNNYVGEKNTDENIAAWKINESAALLHDLGHPSYSHALELDCRQNHKDKAVELIENSELAGILEKYSIDAKRVYNIITEENDSFEVELIAGEIGTDRLAYVPFDTKSSAVFMQRSERLNTQEQMHLSNIFKKRDNKKGVINLEFIDKKDEYYKDVLETINKLFYGRSYLHANLYGNTANAKSVTLIRNAVQSAMEDQLLTEDEVYSLHERLLLEALYKNPKTKYIVEPILEENLPYSALWCSVSDEDMEKVLELKKDRDKRLEFQEKVGGWLDINPLGSAPRYETYFKSPDETEQLKELCAMDYMQVAGYHKKQVTNRFNVFAYPGKNRKKVAQKSLAELGIEKVEKLHGDDIPYLEKII